MGLETEAIQNSASAHGSFCCQVAKADGLEVGRVVSGGDQDDGAGDGVIVNQRLQIRLDGGPWRGSLGEDCWATRTQQPSEEQALGDGLERVHLHSGLLLSTSSLALSVSRTDSLHLRAKYHGKRLLLH
jgi:hypothetical protein